MRNAIFALIPALMAAPAAAQSNTGITEFTLDNGMQILVREDHRAPVVVSQVWYRIGSSYEKAGETGLSHLFEHMMFKGTEKYAEGEFSEIISREGGRLNAFTGRDFSAYFEVMAADRLPIALELEADRMANLQINAEALETEREVVLEERRLRTDDRPEGRFGERYAAIAHPGTGYAHPIIGWADDVAAFDVEDLEGWYQQWYTPTNATLVVAGDVQPDEVHSLAREYFGDIEAREVPTVHDADNLQPPGERRLIHRDPQARVTQLRMGYEVPSFPTAESNQDPYALLMLATILDGGEGARLAEELVRGSGVAAAAGASYNPMVRLDSQFSLFGVPADGDVDAVETALRDQIQRLQDEPVSTEELERARSQMLADHLFEMDSVFYQAMQLGMLETTGSGWARLNSFEENVRDLTAEDLQSAARQYLRPEMLAVGVMQPTDQEDEG
ncbi:M16 family metallopeptidase [Spiribacter vilamensis]|uniref:Zinc protease n=1 Tax=Spiribacter vilamensis TaxID=531306 RepID=A0A4Q8D210_9GAMM|nr:pitrilysin family protein [Spiribacter vilamensis]RZU99317.1 zinc protease [Spiribacter vilamensis]TVO61699.1 insulinase family protein [Spiribacter vilamensis]